MRGRLKADLISRALETGEPGEAVSLDPELRDLERLASLLSIVSRCEPGPSEEAQRRIGERVEECQRRVLQEKAKREGDPARRVRVAEPGRASYAAMAAAAMLAVALVVSSVVLTGPGVVSVPPTLKLAEAEAWVFATGDVEVRPPGGEWSRQSPPFFLAAGSSVRVPEGSRAELAFGGLNLARLDSGSEADLMAVAESGISMQLRLGRGYFRAHGVPLRVFGGGLQAEARGTVFDLNLKGPDPVLLAIDDEVAVEVLQGGTRSEVMAEGKMCTLPDLLGGGGIASLIEDIRADVLLDEWLLWNRLLDRERGWDLGVLSEVEEPDTAALEIARMESGESPQPQPTPLPDGENGGENPDGEAGQPELSLEGTVQKAGVSLSWEIRNGAAQEFILLRSAEREPAYPGDVLARLAGGARSYLDAQVQPGTTYSYRLAVRHDGGMVYSNVVKLSIPEVKPAMTLSGRVIDGGGGRPVIELTWHVEGDPRADSYALVRAEMNQLPSYPPVSNMLSWGFSPGAHDYSFIDRELYMGYTYNYRVYAIRDSVAVLQSNAVSIYVDTSVIQKAGGQDASR